MPAANPDIDDVPCSRPGCTATYRGHAWGAIKAGGDGWFMQKNGDRWCPDHHPEWVAEWRRRQDTPPEELACDEHSCATIVEIPPGEYWRARKQGWVLQRNGMRWCPTHRPAWAAQGAT